MRIQIIDYNRTNVFDENIIKVSLFSKIFAFDDFDVNIVNLSNEKLWDDVWYNHNRLYGDCWSIKTSVMTSKKTFVVFVLPKNYQVFKTSSFIKDILDDDFAGIISCIMPDGYIQNLVYEITKTVIEQTDYHSDFHFFNTPYEIKTQSEKSEKITTVWLGKTNPNVYVTTLDIAKDTNSILTFVKSVVLPSQTQEPPDWVKEYKFDDDVSQMENIAKSQTLIATETEKIDKSEKKLSENLKYKSILFTNGNELVDVVFEVLEKLLKTDLSTFEDKKQEDFLIKFENITFIGEIKGITSNVKRDNLSQIERHYQSYCDELDENGDTEKVKQLLIINPLRNNPLEEREPIHENQIKLAERNNCLIIETITLLKIFEMFLNEKISTEDCIKIFAEKTGLLSVDDVNN